jgi:hypothetical protein
MSKHDQKGDAPTFVCTACKYFDCKDCIDELRSVYTDDKICRCRRKNHAASIAGEVVQGDGDVPVLSEPAEPA